MENHRFSQMIFVGLFSVDHCFTIIKRWFGRIQGSRNLCRLKTVSEKGMRNRTKTEPTWSRRGRDLGRGSFGSVYGFRVIPMDTRPAPGGCGGCFSVQNGDMGLPGSTYLFILDVLVRCQKPCFFERHKLY